MKNYPENSMDKIRISHCIGILIIIPLVLASFSCAGMGAESTVDEDPGAKEQESEQEMEKEPSHSFHNSYSERDLLKALVQYNHLAMYGDYFPTYANMGDPTFEDFLVDYFALETGTYKPGEGTIFSDYDNTGEVRERITRIFLGGASEDSGTGERTEEGWWRIEQERGDERFVYEVLVDTFSVPREVRFIFPGNGQVYSRKTMFGVSVEEAQASMTDEEIAAVLEEERQTKLGESSDRLGLRVDKTREEFIQVGGAQVYSVHFSGTLGNGAIPVEIWYSPDLPGNLLRMRGKGQVMFEVTQVLEEQKRKFPDEVTEPFPEG